MNALFRCSSIRCECEAVDERVGGGRIRSKEELPLRTPSGHHVDPARDNLSRHGHAWFSARSRSEVRKINPGAASASALEHAGPLAP
jgi:hypothetical protein